MSVATTMRGGTVLFELLRALEHAGEYNAQDQSAPAAILWTDKDRQWEPLAPRLREALPQFLILGPYAPGERTGPAIWIRCMIERTLSEANWSESAIPILYLPGVSRQEIRAVEECPRELLPLAELRGRRLHATDFQVLLQPDLVKELLRWLDAPAVTRHGWTAEEWQAFRGACRERYGFDPEKDGELGGAEKLGAREGSWDPVWRRLVEAPEAYPYLPELLRRAKPRDENNLFFHRECWPQCNEAAESELRSGLDRVASLGPDAAATEIEKLESLHAERRGWVWAKFGLAPLARALEHLALLARATRTKLGGENPTAMATAYATWGWRADAAVLDALAGVFKAADVAAVKAAIQAVYTPWLEASAERFQDRVRETPAAYVVTPSALREVVAGTCIVFADGLRLDLAKRLRATLETAEFLVE